MTEPPKANESELNPKINEKFNFIKKVLCEKLKVNEVNFNLIYKATRDGDSKEIFHSKCDNINNTLVIIKTNKNNIFGGFTTALWNVSGGVKYDSYSFLFSLNKNKIFNIKSTFQWAISCLNNNCITFGMCSDNIYELYLANRFLSTYENYVYNGLLYFNENDPAFILNNGMRNFKVEECEIYQVIPKIE